MIKQNFCRTSDNVSLSVYGDFCAMYFVSYIPCYIDSMSSCARVLLLHTSQKLKKTFVRVFEAGYSLLRSLHFSLKYYKVWNFLRSGLKLNFWKKFWIREWHGTIENYQSFLECVFTFQSWNCSSNERVDRSHWKLYTRKQIGWRKPWKVWAVVQ